MTTFTRFAQLEMWSLLALYSVVGFFVSVDNYFVYGSAYFCSDQLALINTM